jgi:osmotically-inducible protein OsmY
MMSTELSEKVQKALDDDGRITSKHIHISIRDGAVTLEGVVDSLAEFGIAEEIVEAVPGVESVDNHLQIEGKVDTGPCCPQM